MATTVTKTVRPSGGDYTSLSAWEAGEQANLVTLDQIRQAECYAMNDTTRVTIDGWTTDATRYIRIYTPTAQRHPGKWDDSKYKLNVNQASVDALDVCENYVKIEGLQIMLTSASADIGVVEFLVTSGAAECFIDKCIVRGSLTGTNPEGLGNYGCGSNSSFKWIVRNTIIQDVMGTWANNACLSTWIGTCYAYNCTAYHGKYGFYCGGGTAYWKNCLASYCDTGGFSGGTQTTCYTNTAAPPDPHFVSTASPYDLHLQSDDHVCKNQGTDLSSDSYYPFSDDIDSQTRPTGAGTWDIGADEYVAGGTVHEAAVAFASSSSFSDSVLADLMRSLSLPSQASQAEQGLADMLNALVLSAQGAHSPTAAADRQGAISLQGSGVMSDDAARDFPVAETLSAQAAFGASEIAGLFAALQFSGIAGLSPAGQLIADLATILSSQASFLSNWGGSIFDVAVGLPAGAGISPAAQRDRLASLSYSALCSIQQALERYVSAALGLSSIADLTAQQTTDLAAQIQIGAQADIDTLAQQVAESLAQAGANAEFAAAAAGTFDKAMQLSIAALFASLGSTEELFERLLSMPATLAGADVRPALLAGTDARPFELEGSDDRPAILPGGGDA